MGRVIIIIIIIKEPGQGKTHKYLGIKENEGIQHEQMKEGVKVGIPQEMKNDTEIRDKSQE
jgi:hypothetical protein